MGWKAFAIHPGKTPTNLRSWTSVLRVATTCMVACRQWEPSGTELDSCYGRTDNEWKQGRDKGIPTLASSTMSVTCCSIELSGYNKDAE